MSQSNIARSSRIRVSITGKFAILLLVMAAGTLAGVGAYYGYVTRNDETHQTVIQSLSARNALLHRRLDKPSPLKPEDRETWRSFVPLSQHILDALDRGGNVEGRYVARVPDQMSPLVREASGLWRGTRSILLEAAEADAANEKSVRERLHHAFPRYEAAINRLRAGLESRRTSLRNHMWNTFLAIVAIHLVFLIIGVWATRRMIVRPILLVEAAARRIAAGDYSRVTVVSNDETGELAAAFNRMIQDLDATINALRDSERALADKADELASINAELEQYAYAASHDLQEPLRIVMTYSQLLRRQQRGHLDTDSELFLAFIENGAARMHRLVVDLLSYSQVVHGTEASYRVDSDIAVRDAIASCSVGIGETGAKIRCEPLPPVLADQTEMELVFQNLIGNAIKYRGSAPPEIDITASTDGAVCTIRVRDNGIGIRAEYHKRIFGLFKRLHGRELPGTGVGLALTKKIVEKHGGRIAVESAEGQGTTFVFTLQACDSSGGHCQLGHETETLVP